MQRFIQQVARKRKLLERHHQELGELLAQCLHETLEQKERYYEGSYYDRASTDYWSECTICGKRLNKRTETHSWYG
jgi:hypothetical protein